MHDAGKSSAPKESRLRFRSLDPNAAVRVRVGYLVSDQTATLCEAMPARIMIMPPTETTAIAPQIKKIMPVSSVCFLMCCQYRNTELQGH